VKRFGRHRRCRRFLYPRGTFPKLFVPRAHMFENICICDVYLSFALYVGEGVATRREQRLFNCLPITTTMVILVVGAT
jgi:hypothetical protein